MDRRPVVRRGLAAAAAACALAASALLVAGAAGAQTPNAGNADGTTVNGTFRSPTGGPVYAFGVNLTGPLAANLTNISCGPGGRTDMRGGPNGAPECFPASPGSTVSFTLTGARPWTDVVRTTDPQATSFTLPGFYSADNATYITLAPGQYLVINLPALVVAPTTPPTTPPVNKPRSAQGPVKQLRHTTGKSNRWKWAGLLGVGLVTLGVGVALKDRADTDERDVVGPLLTGSGLYGREPRDMVDVDEIRKGFLVAQEALTQSVNQQLHAMAMFDAAYAAAWADAMNGCHNYVHDYRAIIPDLKKLWDSFPDRDWANAHAKYVEDIVNYTIAIHGAGSGAIGLYKYIGAAEMAYAAQFAEGTALKAASAFANAGTPVALVGDVEQARQASQALIAAAEADALAVQNAERLGAQLQADAAVIEREATAASNAAKAAVQADVQAGLTLQAEGAQIATQASQQSAAAVAAKQATAFAARTQAQVNAAITDYFGNAMSNTAREAGATAQWSVGVDASEAERIWNTATSAPYDGSSAFHATDLNHLVVPGPAANDPTFLVHEALHAHSPHIPMMNGTGMTEALTDGFTANIIGPQNITANPYTQLGWTQAGQQIIDLAPQEAKAFYGGTGTESALANAIDAKLGTGTYDTVKGLIEPVTDASGTTLFNETKANVTKARLILKGAP